MIIGISGSQGQGKTTLADGLVRNDSSFEIIGSNLARSTMYHMDLTSSSSFRKRIPSLTASVGALKNLTAFVHI